MTTAQLFDYRSLMRHPLPAADGARDKNERGRVLAVAGAPQAPGAAILSGEACLRAGAGKVQIAIARALCPALGMTFPECGLIALDEGAAPAALTSACVQADAVLIGPGLDDEAATLGLVQTLLAAPTEACFVLDALALKAIAAAPAPSSVQVAITPHRGELADMMGVDKAAIDADPLGNARKLAARRNCLVVLKDATTYVAAPGGEAWVHHHGVPGLGTSGSGDVLAGILTGLIASGVGAIHAALWAVAVHAEAGRILSRDIAQTGFLARDLLGRIAELLRPSPARA